MAPDLDGRCGTSTSEAASPADVMEITLLLPGWQVEALEAAARDRGLTAGQMVRRLIREYFVRREQDAADRPDATSPW
jgi:hypothetical protein